MLIRLGSCLFLIATVLLWYELAQSFPVVLADVRGSKTGDGENEKAEDEGAGHQGHGQVHMSGGLGNDDQRDHARSRGAQHRSTEETEKVEDFQIGQSEQV